MEYLIRLQTGSELRVETAERLERKSRELSMTATSLIAQLIEQGLDEMDGEHPIGAHAATSTAPIQ